MDRQDVSRRAVLRGVAGGFVVLPAVDSPTDSSQLDLAPTAFGSPSTTARVPSSPETTQQSPAEPSENGASVTVLTQNLYLGTNLLRALREPDNIPRVVGELFTDVENTEFEARAEAIVEEIAARRPHLVGLQEVAQYRIQVPGDYEALPGVTNASRPYLDFLEVLQEKLARRRLRYDVVSSVTNADIELPAALDAGRIDVRLTDRDVILARSDLPVRKAGWANYDASITLPLPDDITYELTRGYCTVDVEVDGLPFTFVNTHLESIAAETQINQARELIVALGTLDGPVVLVGDFNSNADGTDTVTYGLLTQFFTDAYAEANPTDPGYTCCHPPGLQNRSPRLDRRIDLVLYQKPGQTLSAARVGIDPADKATTRIRGETVRLWPSDHAGVVATLALEPPTLSTPTPEPMASPTPPSETDTSTTVGADGFGIVAGLLSVVAIGAALLRQCRRT